MLRSSSDHATAEMIASLVLAVALVLTPLRPNAPGVVHRPLGALPQFSAPLEAPRHAVVCAAEAEAEPPAEAEAEAEAEADAEPAAEEGAEDPKAALKAEKAELKEKIAKLEKELVTARGAVAAAKDAVADAGEGGYLLLAANLERFRLKAKEEMSLQAKANDVFEEHHQGRRWAETLALMTRHTGAYRELDGFKTPYGGRDEDGVDPWIPTNLISQAKETAKMKSRVAARKLYDFRNTPGGLNFKSHTTPTPSAEPFAAAFWLLYQANCGSAPPWTSAHFLENLGFFDDCFEVSSSTAPAFAASARPIEGCCGSCWRLSQSPGSQRP